MPRPGSAHELLWIVPVLSTLVPITLAALNRPNLKLKRPADRKSKERELLSTLAERGELTPTTAAMRTSLTVDEASKTLEELSRIGPLRPQADDVTMVYALHEGVRYETPDEVPEPSRGSENLLASGRTNTEVARHLFVSVGTVKSHTGNIYRKLGSKNRAEAITRARDLNLLQ